MRGRTATGSVYDLLRQSNAITPLLGKSGGEVLYGEAKCQVKLSTSNVVSTGGSSKHGSVSI
jgi:hypothetical protein